MFRRRPIFALPPFLALFLVGFSLAPSFSLVAANNQQGQFLLITDFHIDQKYDRHGNRTNMCHPGWKGPNETPKKRGTEAEGGKPAELGPYGERTCDAPPALVEYMLDEAKREMPKPDFIIWTGDSMAHVAYDDKEFLKTMKTAGKMIQDRFKDTLVIPVLGNHDMSPSNSFPDDGQGDELKLYAAIFDLWKPWIGEQARETFLKGGYYRFKSPVDESDYLVLNTNMYYVLNQALPTFAHPEDPTGQFKFLEDQLKEVKRRNGAVHILAHLPPGGYEWDSYGTVWNPEMPKKYNQRLVDLFVEYAPWIRWMLFGHLHTDTFRILKDSAGKPVQRMFISPAVTPMYELNNPAFRVFEYNKTNFDINDIKTFYVDLDELNREGAEKVHARLEYSMRAEYGLDSLDAVGMNELLEKMRRNMTIFESYVRHNKVMHNAPNATQADRVVHLCVIDNVNLDHLEECSSMNAAGAKPMISAMSTTILLSLLLTSFGNY